MAQTLWLLRLRGSRFAHILNERSVYTVVCGPITLFAQLSFVARCLLCLVRHNTPMSQSPISKNNGRVRSDLMLSSLQIPVLNPVIRSEEHTSELQLRGHLVCRLLLAKNI